MWRTIIPSRAEWLSVNSGGSFSQDGLNHIYQGLAMAFGVFPHFSAARPVADPQAAGVHRLFQGRVARSS
jgi:hypothetical protein